MENVKGVILIVEDNAGLNELLSEKIQECGHETYSVHSAFQAFEWLENNSPFLMLLDFSLPDITGKELIELLISEKFPIPPFIVATGQGDERIAVQMMKLGARDYIIKDSNFLEMIPILVTNLSGVIQKEHKLLSVEIKLTELNEYTNQIIKSAQEGIIVYDLECNYKVWNPFMEKITGVQSKDVLGKYILDVFPFLTGTAFENLKLALKGELTSEFEFYFEIPETGKSGWVSEIVSPLRNAEDIIIGAITSCHDITERKRAEKLRIESDEKYRELVENSPDAIVIYIDDKIVFVNNACLGLIGASSANELIGKSVIEFVHPDSRSLIMERLKTITEPGMVLDLKEEQFVRLDNSLIEVEVKAMSLNMDNKLAVQLIVRDISERKQSERELINRKNLFRKLLFTSTELIDSSSNEINYEHISDIAQEISGAKYVCFNVFDEKGPGFKTVAFSGISNFQENALSLFGFQIINKKWDYDPIREEKIKDNTITEFESLEMLAGSLIPTSILNKLQKVYKFGKIDVVKITKKNRTVGDFTLLLEEGESIKNPEILELFANQVGLFIDRQVSEEKLRKNEEKFRILFAGNPQPMFVYDVQTLEILEVNQTALNFYGYSEEDFLSIKATELHPLEEIPIFLQSVEKTKAGINTDGISNHVKKNGEKITVEIFTAGATNFGKNARHVLVVDITERKLAESALRQSEYLYRNLVERIPDGVYKSTPEGKFIETNHAMVGMLGYETKEEMMAIDIKTDLYFNPQDRESLILDESSQETGIYQLKKKDGSGIWVEDHGWYNTDDNGNVLSHEGVLRDITDRKLSEEALKQKMEELMRFQHLTVGREHAMIELKREINKLLIGIGEKEKYKIVE
ncbi:MAG: PAS domain S-box protein [Paludibacter sp.]|nr:PAS domain S-box protein [Paludibacter sp.]